MTWAERFGDLAVNVVLVVLNVVRIFTLLIRIATERIDGLVTALSERSEGGIRQSDTRTDSWISLPASVLWGAAAIVLRLLSIVTVFVRQVSFTVDEFLRVLAEGETTSM